MECSAECSSNSESGFCEWELDERGEAGGKRWEEEGKSPDLDSKRRLRAKEERGEGRRIWRQAAASTQDWTL